MALNVKSTESCKASLTRVQFCCGFMLQPRPWILKLEYFPAVMAAAEMLREIVWIKGSACRSGRRQPREGREAARRRGAVKTGHTPCCSAQSSTILRDGRGTCQAQPQFCSPHSDSVE